MIRNYLKIAYRNLIKSRLSSLINIIGMTVGMASFLVIAIFIFDEISYDEYHPDKERTYRVYNVGTSDDGEVHYFPVAPPVYATSLQQFPEVETTLRIMDTYGEVMFKIGDNKFFERQVIYAEPSIFDILSLELIKGNEEKALAERRQVIIARSFAESHFKDDPVGQVISLDQGDFTVTGVFEDIPEHSHLQTKVVISFSTLYRENFDMSRMESWYWQQFFTYVKLHEKADRQAFENKFTDYVIEKGHPLTSEYNFTYLPHLQRIDDIYLHSSNFEWEIAKRGNIYTVQALSASALFILLIVCINFINLSTARSIKRIKEVGIRKAIGASRKQLIVQFLGESILLSIISIVLAGIIVEMLLPIINQLIEKNLSLGFLYDPATFTLILCLAMLLGLMAGAYPAIYASHFKAVTLMGKNAGNKPISNLFFRQAMIVIQFSLTIFLVAGSLTIFYQIDYIRNKDLGFDKDQVIFFRIRENISKHLEAVKNELTSHPGISEASYSYGLPGDLISQDNVVREGKNYPSSMFLIDHDYVKTLGIELLAGRDFNEEIATDRTSAFIINETGAKTLGFESPEAALGKELSWDMWHYSDSLKTGKIIGVVKDFHFRSFREDIATTVIHIYPEAYHSLALKVRADKLPETLSYLKEKWSVMESEWPFTYSFLDEGFNKMYTSDQRLYNFFTFFTGIAIFISCIGLFGLIYFISNQRVKEIGIRKVLGASSKDIIVLINRGYLALILIAFVIAIPASYYLAQHWLQDFSYKTELSPMIFITAGLVMILITLIATTFQSVKAAMTNPVDVIKDE